MYQLGIVVGKFAPLTLGHINLITEASLQSERVLVVLSHDQRWVDKQSPRDQKVLAIKNRLRWLQQIYADTEHVDITFIDESEADIPEFPNGWPEYAALLNETVFTHLQNSGYAPWDEEPFEMAIFSSELGYDAEYKKYLPEINHVVVDANRTRVPISATKIRNNLYDHWEYLPSIVRRDYTLKVVVLGTESSGKTSLVKNLAKLYNTSWVEEYGRTYVETVLAGSEDTLRSEDYPLIAYRHKELEEQALRSANRLTIIDTNAFITEYYHRLYECCSNRIVAAIAAEEHYDLVLILSSEVKWVADGMRRTPERVFSDALFEEILEGFPNQTPEDRTFRITGQSYKDRLEQARTHIDALLLSNS